MRSMVNLSKFNYGTTFANYEVATWQGLTPHAQNPCNFGDKQIVIPKIRS